MRAGGGAGRERGRQREGAHDGQVNWTVLRERLPYDVLDL